METTQIRDAEGNGGGFTESFATPNPTAEPSELEQQLARILARVPPLITLPKPKARCRYTGESRTGLVELIAPCERNGFKPPVKAIYKRAHKYAQRGQWLIPAENLFRHLLGLAEHSTEDYLQTAKARVEAKQERATEGTQ
jgi:hypothetical protein